MVHSGADHVLQARSSLDFSLVWLLSRNCNANSR